MEEIRGFSEKTCNELGAYVYKLIDPRDGKVFYIGKGRNNRVFDHVYDTAKYMREIEEENLDEESQVDVVSEKINTIMEIKNAGLDVIYVIHRHGLSDEEAILVESVLIDDYNGLTNLQSGRGSKDKGPMNALQVEKLYNLEKIEEFDEADKVLVIKIKENGTDYYEQGRKYWVLNLDRARQAKTAVIVVNGEVKRVVNIDENSWEEMPGYPESYSGKKRYGFKGIVDENSKYLYHLIPDKYMKKGNANPIQYGF